MPFPPQVWRRLSQTGFLPYQRSSSTQVDRWGSSSNGCVWCKVFPHWWSHSHTINSRGVWPAGSISDHVPCSFHFSIVVAPGHYGQLLNVWERPRGIYPISMAMLELLLNLTPPSDSIATADQLACVVFVMREVFAGCHKWRYRSSTQRDEMGMMSFILSCRAWEWECIQVRVASITPLYLIPMPTCFPLLCLKLIGFNWIGNIPIQLIGL